MNQSERGNQYSNMSNNPLTAARPESRPHVFSRNFYSVVNYRVQSMIRMLRRFFDNPGMIGAIAPSSPALVEAMTQQISKDVAVFEIGAGTGAITRQILESERSGPLVVFEQDPYFAECLRRRVGSDRVVEGLFHDTVIDLGEIPDALLILSSVPFMSLSETLHFKTVEAICDILLDSPNRRLIQYTYFDRPPFVPQHASLHWRRLSRVWANIPPATVWELRSRIGPKIDARIDMRAMSH